MTVFVPGIDVSEKGFYTTEGALTELARMLDFDCCLGGDVIVIIIIYEKFLEFSIFQRPISFERRSVYANKVVVFIHERLPDMVAGSKRWDRCSKKRLVDQKT